MSRQNHSIEQEASRAASLWMISLQEAPNDGKLRREFESWLAEPVNAAAWAETQRMAQAVGGAVPTHAESWEPFLQRVRAAPGDMHTRAAHPARHATTGDATWSPPPARRVNRRKVLTLAGVAAAATVAATVAGPEVMRTLNADYTTDVAKTRTIRLPDDSTVTVAPGSAIAVDYTDTERSIRLLEGEIFLDVRPNADLPFRVSAGAVRVTVLGTAFNVTHSDRGAEVGVVHGVVRVDLGEGTSPVAEALQAGEFVRVGLSGHARFGRQPVSEIGAWRQNQLIAQDQAFADVVDRLRRYHSGAIIIADGSLGDEPVTGVYNLTDSEAALRAIARSQKAVVRAFSPWLLVVSRF
ncbi:FecR domain-containing protein [Marivibrio halodurans]|uniref:FecR domain-containing protein n=1 Tax=Marivibrio halodurans TaxID=2039722 RepID=A0A8J7S0H9_9PROT|nr:FecR domain-containing protein [Marivibrio halodurans]MBP5856454.1 FecR domain-containing protein [Marivibrio halodurans]